MLIFKSLGINRAGSKHTLSVQDWPMDGTHLLLWLLEDTRGSPEITNFTGYGGHLALLMKYWIKPDVAAILDFLLNQIWWPSWICDEIFHQTRYGGGHFGFFVEPDMAAILDS